MNRLTHAVNYIPDQLFERQQLELLVEHRRKVAARHRARWKVDPGYKMEYITRGRMRCAMLGKVGRASFKLVGCTRDELRDHIASQFTDGMTWGNYGEWEVDHIRPCASFDLTDEAQRRTCFHFTNLQPLWRKDNREKCAKLDWYMQWQRVLS